MISQETVCECGKYKYWLAEGKVTKNACPNCGKKWIGKYDQDLLGLKAIEHPQPK